MKEFRFINYEVTTDEVVFHYSCHYGDSSVKLQMEGIGTLPETLLGYLGVAFSITAFRIDNFEKIVVEPVALSKKTRQFFEGFFLHGLAEYRYTNGFPIYNGVSIQATPSRVKKLKSPINIQSDKALLMIGGGKDSLVALELLNKIGLKSDFFVYGPSTPSDSIIAKFGAGHKTWRCTPSMQYPEHVERVPGHFPVSALYGFTAVAAAYLHGYNYVVTANEYSANFPNLTHQGFAVNHQYTKSAGFEVPFAHFIKEEMFDCDFFSILRPLYEIQIAAIFQHFPKYFSHFVSCNGAQKQSNPSWCGHCAKCAFVYMILAPLLTTQERQLIWQTNLFRHSSICKFALELATAPTNPLECVGTIEESQTALWMCNRAGLFDTAHHKYRAKLKAAAEEVNIQSLQPLVRDIDRPHTIPPEIWKKIKPVLIDYLAPTLDTLH